MTVLGTVSQIWRYPVSSLGGEQLTAAALDAAGIAGDRCWGVVDAASNAVAKPPERRWRTIADIVARSGAEVPEIRTPGGEWFSVGSPEAEAALSTHFGFPAAIRRYVPFEAEGTAEAVAPRYRRAQIHVLTTASMRALRNRVPTGIIVDPRRFRPNLVVDTPDGIEGFAEAEWIGQSIAIGRTVLRVSEPCERCAFTTLAQGDLPFQKDILSGIVRHGGGFGVLCAILEGREVAIGDPVRRI